MKVPTMAMLTAPASWTVVDFISDLHLRAQEPANFDAFSRYLKSTPADAVFMLGDVFEVWVGDDVIDDNVGLSRRFEALCADEMSAAGERLALFFMHGNRDFLVGKTLMKRCHATLLADPTVLQFAGQNCLLSHGDALCLADTEYLAFRQQVQQAPWQRAFLARPLAERQAIALALRAQSQARHKEGAAYAEVDSAAAIQWLQAAGAQTLIHGHTHRPGTHDLGQGLQRVVLSDWDAAAHPPRAEVLRLSATGLQRLALPV
jgi:UDP-2,3-diacylglucosamine hydrolase